MRHRQERHGEGRANQRRKSAIENRIGLGGGLALRVAVQRVVGHGLTVRIRVTLAVPPGSIVLVLLDDVLLEPHQQLADTARWYGHQWAPVIAMGTLVVGQHYDGLEIEGFAPLGRARGRLRSFRRCGGCRRRCLRRTCCRDLGRLCCLLGLGWSGIALPGDLCSVAAVAVAGLPTATVTST